MSAIAEEITKRKQDQDQEDEVTVKKHKAVEATTTTTTPVVDVSRSAAARFLAAITPPNALPPVEAKGDGTQSQFTPEELAQSRPESLDIYGDWSRDEAKLAELQKLFSSADPFPYVLIPNFFKEEVAEQIEQEFPGPHDPMWFVYNNPIERKLAQNIRARLPPTAQRVFADLNSPESVALMTRLTGLDGLQADPFLHGGGLHGHPAGGKLDMHLDYSVHPLSGKERRVNLIVYLSKNWKEEFGGGLQLWDSQMSECRWKAPVGFNVGVMFRTSDMSFHGLPDPINCPDGMMRKSLAIYYVSDPRVGATQRLKAQFFSRPSDPASPFMDRLREIRPQRRIQPEDLVGWEEEQKRLLALGFDT